MLWLALTLTKLAVIDSFALFIFMPIFKKTVRSIPELFFFDFAPTILCSSAAKQVILVLVVQVHDARRRLVSHYSVRTLSDGWFRQLIRTHSVRTGCGPVDIGIDLCLNLLLL